MKIVKILLNSQFVVNSDHIRTFLLQLEIKSMTSVTEFIDEEYVSSIKIDIEKEGSQILLSDETVIIKDVENCIVSFFCHFQMYRDLISEPSRFDLQTVFFVSSHILISTGRKPTPKNLWNFTLFLFAANIWRMRMNKFV